MRQYYGYTAIYIILLSFKLTTNAQAVDADSYNLQSQPTTKITRSKGTRTYATNSTGGVVNVAKTPPKSMLDRRGNRLDYEGYVSERKVPGKTNNTGSSRGTR
ncbi:MAG: hypothetical protein KAJ63_12855 [Methyloprofundus sp.]|nr:hypothetical protein [Methyloprofundus sp.]